MRDRILFISDRIVSSHMSDPAAARGQAIMAFGQTIEDHASIAGYSGMIAVLGAMLILLACVVLLTRNHKRQPARASRRA